MGNEVVEVNSIVVDAYSPYTTILAKDMASCYRGSLFHLAYEGEVPNRWTCGRVGRMPKNG